MATNDTTMLRPADARAELQRLFDEQARADGYIDDRGFFTGPPDGFPEDEVVRCEPRG